jgi:hypothetical protein
MRNSAYSPIRHLAHALLLNHDPDQTLMVMLTAYLDASMSQQGAQVITIAGFVSTETKWLKFEKSWNAILNKYEVPYLHMNEFACSTGVFKAWKGEEKRRRRFLIDLIRVAKKGVHKGFACSMLMKDFEELNQEFRLREHWGNEYAFIGMNVVTSIMNWKNKQFPHAKIKYVFEDGDLGNEHLKRCLQFESIPYSFTPKKACHNGILEYVTPFQIADFSA